MTNAIEFNFKTAKDSGIVILNRENKKTFATIEGNKFEVSINSEPSKGAFFMVNLLVLNSFGLINAPKLNKEVGILLVGEEKETMGGLLDRLENIVRESPIKGKFYNGTFFSDEKVAKMTYTEKVICGVHAE
jgi:hypothetical protein